MYVGYVLHNVRQAGSRSKHVTWHTSSKNAKLVLPVVLGTPPPYLASRDPTLATAQGRLQPDAVHFNYRAPSALEWCLNFEF